MVGFHVIEFEYPTNEPFIWLILSTNDCWPGCGCDRDRYTITEFRVYRWIKRVGIEEAAVALDQLTNIENFTEKDFRVLSNYTLMPCGTNEKNHSEFLRLVSESKSKLKWCMDRLSAQPRN